MANAYKAANPICLQKTQTGGRQKNAEIEVIKMSWLLHYRRVPSVRRESHELGNKFYARSQAGL